MKPIVILKNRSDIGAETRGSDMGIDALEVAAINAGNDFFKRYPHIDIETHNDSVYDKVKHTFAKRIHSVTRQCERVKRGVSSILEKSQFPLVLSGDHSSAIGTIAALKSLSPNARLGVVWIDAHADLHSPYSSPSGNIHGMSVAACLGLDNQEYKINQVDQHVMRDWEILKGLGGVVPMVYPEDIIYLGLRCTEDQEEEIIHDLEINCCWMHDIGYRSLESCLVEGMSKMSHVDYFYISFDVDAFDCDYVSDGTGYPVSDGFKIYEIIEILQKFFDTGKVVAFEVCEINPLLDTGGNDMAEATFDVISSVIGR